MYIKTQFPIHRCLLLAFLYPLIQPHRNFCPILAPLLATMIVGSKKASESFFAFRVSLSVDSLLISTQVRMLAVLALIAKIPEHEMQFG